MSRCHFLIYWIIINDAYFCFSDRALVLSEKQETFIVDSPSEISDREVSPKLVVGTKKYGRRSRPHNQNKNSDQLMSDSDDTNDEQDVYSHRSCNAQQVKRSTSQTDIPGSRRYCNTIVTENKLKRCASLPAQKNIFNQNKTKLASSKGKLGRDLPIPITKTTLSSSVESLGKYYHTVFKHLSASLFVNASKLLIHFHYIFILPIFIQYNIHPYIHTYNE